MYHTLYTNQNIKVVLTGDKLRRIVGAMRDAFNSYVKALGCGAVRNATKHHVTIPRTPRDLGNRLEPKPLKKVHARFSLACNHSCHHLIPDNVHLSATFNLPRLRIVKSGRKRSSGLLKFSTIAGLLNRAAV